MIFLWLTFIIGGFLFGSVLFSKIIPKLFIGRDICELGSDGNPGAANVFMKCGVKMGAICLLCDILKGFIPVFIGTFLLDTESMWFSLVIAVPALGHAVGIFNRFHGGKCISTSFGIVLGLMPITRIGFLLAILYIIFSTLIKLKPHSLRSVVSFGLFAIGASLILCITGKYSIALGCVIFSIIAILKHLFVPNKQEEEISDGEKTYCAKIQ
jgi:glycerol-3-phosphate acyltransferase PlsY